MPLIFLFFRYKEVSLEEAKNNKKVEMTFSVSYRYLQLLILTTFVKNYPTRQKTKSVFFRMNMINVEKDVEIAAGVMSALAVLLGAVDAWSWSKRYVLNYCNTWNSSQNNSSLNHYCFPQILSEPSPNIRLYTISF